MPGEGSGQKREMETCEEGDMEEEVFEGPNPVRETTAHRHLIGRKKSPENLQADTLTVLPPLE